VLRFWNLEVLREIEDVFETIAAALDGRLERYERLKTTRQA
jgi:very-short-patch-repair endonuclease